MTRTFNFSRFPRLGVGLGLNSSDATELYLKRIGHEIDFFEVTVTNSAEHGPASYVEVARRLRNPNSFRQLVDYPGTVPRLIHGTRVNVAYPSASNDHEALRKIVMEVKSPWVTEDLGIWSMEERHTYPYFLPLELSEETLAVAIENVKIFQDVVGVPFIAEFPNFRMILGNLNAFDFMRRLCKDSGCGMCADIGHILSYQIARGASATADLHLLPWDSIVEIHVAGGSIDLTADGFEYLDSHADYPVVSACWDLLDTIVVHASNLKAIAFEAFGATSSDGVIATLKRIRARPEVARWLNGLPPSIVDNEPQEGFRQAVRDRAVATFDLLHISQITGERLIASGRFLEYFAPAEKARWERECKDRLSTQGENLTALFPYTALWLERRRLRFPSRIDIYEALLAGLPGSNVPTLEKLTNRFEQLVLEDSADDIGLALLRTEEWMNACAREPDRPVTRTVQVDILSVMASLRSGNEVDPSALRKNIEIAHTGACRFVYLEAEIVPPNIKTDHPGTAAPCCSGR